MKMLRDLPSRMLNLVRIEKLAEHGSVANTVFISRVPLWLGQVGSSPSRAARDHPQKPG